MKNNAPLKIRGLFVPQASTFPDLFSFSFSFLPLSA
jgi:hypothetical protein